MRRKKARRRVYKRKEAKRLPFIISVRNRERGGQTRPSPAISLFWKMATAHIEQIDT